jgi:SAM-dependent methyltransferase
VTVDSHSRPPSSMGYFTHKGTDMQHRDFQLRPALRASLRGVNTLLSPLGVQLSRKPRPQRIARPMDEYERRLPEQQAQYTTGAEIHDLPEIYFYWENRYVVPYMRQVFGANSAIEIYVLALAKLLERDRARKYKFVSVGSGDCSQEIKIAKRLLELGHANFAIMGLEVAEHLIVEAKAAIGREGLSKQITSSFFDVNRHEIESPVDAFIAHHSLHHIVELERLFRLIDNCLTPNGHFITCDMIGRNGHMRWPETLRYVEAIWANLPDVKKYNWFAKERQPEYINIDCSTEGFEGIRAQDILPLLVERFSFERFVGFGGFIDPFIDRAFGRNFDPKNPLDCDFIDVVAAANDAMLETDQIKPTMMLADIVKKRSDVTPRVVGRRTPSFCVRCP